MSDKKRLFLPFGGLIYLACFGMSCYIPVGMPHPLPGWVISMFVSYAMDLTAPLLMCCCGGDPFFAAFVSLAWMVTAGLMIAGGPDCNAGSAWYDSLIPSPPQNGATLEYTAYVKCVFSGFQLANGAAHLLVTGIMVLYYLGLFACVGCAECADIEGKSAAAGRRRARWSVYSSVEEGRRSDDSSFVDK